eukprot:TRINITY_DN1564_c0_g1_i1.p2 TRINITY_DN1564_c0_g1~~TRINITY_DN1564_c0_g1_i1.p2  ORF type:complete len:108 (+),score=8.34 TRINITY_DN1564_c0_g1_i1:37-360(+)
MGERFDFLFKFIVIGDTNTGKSCILHRFLENKFKKDSGHTIGVEFGSKICEVGEKRIKLQIWDTAGQERCFLSFGGSPRKVSPQCIMCNEATACLPGVAFNRLTVKR